MDDLWSIKHPILEDTESSQSGLHKTSIFGWDLQACSESSKSGLYKTFTFGWFTSMLRIIQKWITQTSTFIQNWIIQIIQIRMISSTFQFYIGTDIYHQNLDDRSHNWPIIHIWMICVNHISSTFGSGTYLSSGISSHLLEHTMDVNHTLTESLSRIEFSCFILILARWIRLMIYCIVLCITVTCWA